MSESNNNTPMRITQLEEATSYPEGAYLPIAKAGYGTKKILADVPNLRNVAVDDIADWLTFNNNQYIQIPSTGQQASLTPTTSSILAYAQSTCQAGDKFLVNITGYVGDAVAYAWLKSDYTVITRASFNERLQGVITAPDNAAYLILNTLMAQENYYAHKYDRIKTRVKNIEDVVFNPLNNKNNVVVVRGSWDGANGKASAYNNYFVCTDQLYYAIAGSYVLNPNAKRVVVSKYSENNPKSYISASTTWSTKIQINDSGWYGFSIRNDDYSAFSPSDFPSSNFFLYYDEKHIPEKKLEAHFIGGGKGYYPLGGDNTLFTTPTGKKLAVDMGGEIAVTVCKNAYFKYGGLKLDYIVISHYHNDHIGGLVKGLEDGWLDIEGETLFLPDQSAFEYVVENNLIDATSYDLYERLQTALENFNVTKIYPSAELETYYMDDYSSLIFFNTDQSYLEGETDDYNNFSLGCFVNFGNTKICMTGDMSLLAEKHVAGKIYKCNILKAMHHGYDGQEAWLDPDFMSNVFPQIVISEDGNTHTDKIMTAGAAQQSWCERYGVPNYRTNVLGIIDLTVTEQGYRIDSPVTAYIRNSKNWTYTDNHEYNP